MRITVVDAFTNRPFTGNPAAVCLLFEPASAQWMQRVAAQMNLSETAFVELDPGLLEGRGDGVHHLRWFTPACEVDLCGHATLAAAHVLWETKRLEPLQTARFQTRSGLLECRLEDGGWIAMDFPSQPVEPTPMPDALPEALKTAAVKFVGRNRMDILVELDSEAAVRTLLPDLQRLQTIDTRGLIITARADPDAPHDFVSRFFAPRAGVPEDPVTGSAHCALAPYWSSRLGSPCLTGHQASPRGGTVRVENQGPRVILRGQALTTLRGRFIHDPPPPDEPLP